MKIPSISGCPSGILWLWHSDGTGPAVFRWSITWSAWEGVVSRLEFGQVMQDGWKWCAGYLDNALPTDPECLMRLNQVSWEGLPDWYFDLGVSQR